MDLEGEGRGAEVGTHAERAAASPTASEHGILDTSVVIDLEHIDPAQLPDQTFITAITLAELAAGPHTAVDGGERARRQERLLWATMTWDPLPFDGDAARVYGTLVAAVRASGRQSRSRVVDLLIAAIAGSRGLTLFTRNPADFRGLDGVVTVVAV
jgi:predicted nucleic acid-binding protein